jgi:TPR repeat protein
LQGLAPRNATAELDREDLLQAPTLPDAAAKPDRDAVFQAPASPDEAWLDQGAALREPGITLKLQPDEIAILLRRAQDMLKLGDIPAARVVLRRAAEAGNSEAAFMLASTFDPNVLREVGVIGLAPDQGTALSWYEKASALGSEKAERSIQRLRQAGDR